MSPIVPTLAAPFDGAPADLEGFTHHFAEVNGTRIHYVSGGAGPAVVLLHGWPLTWREWRGIMPALAQAGFTVVAPDLRGLGDSDKPSNGYDKKTVAADIRAIVHKLGFETVDLVGTDIGMMVAVSWVLHHATEIRRLVLAESLIPGFGLEELMNPATGGYWHFGFHAQVELATMLTEGQGSRISRQQLEDVLTAEGHYRRRPGGVPAHLRQLGRHARGLPTLCGATRRRQGQPRRV